MIDLHPYTIILLSNNIKYYDITNIIDIVMVISYHRMWRYFYVTILNLAMTINWGKVKYSVYLNHSHDVSLVVILLSILVLFSCVAKFRASSKYPQMPFSSTIYVNFCDVNGDEWIDISHSYPVLINYIAISLLRTDSTHITSDLHYLGGRMRFWWQCSIPSGPE